MTHRTGWDYIFDICDSFPPSAKNTFIENFLDMPEYAEKMNLLLALVPSELDDAELGQAWTDTASFQYAINNFYEFESDKYSTDLNDQVTELVSKTRAQREAIEAEVDRRGLRYAFAALSEWEPAQS